MKTLTAEDILAMTEKVGEVFKFVKVGTPYNDQTEYRFIKLQVYGPVHRDMVSEEDNERALAAGTIMLRPCSWRISDRYSGTLRVGCTGEHEVELQALLGRTPHSELVMQRYEEEQARQQEERQRREDEQYARDREATDAKHDPIQRRKRGMRLWGGE